MVKQFGKKCRNLTDRKLLYPEESCQIAMGRRFFRMSRGIETVSPGPEVKMIRLLGKNNDLRTEEGKITKTGYAVMILSSVFGLGLFLTGRYIYGKKLKEK